MNIMFYAIALTLILVLSYFIGRFAFKKNGSASSAIRINIMTFVLLALMFTLFSFTATAAPVDNAAPPAPAATADTAAPATAAETQSNSDNGMSKSIAYLAAALAVGFAGIGGGIAVGSAAPAAIGATSEDPKNFGKSLIFVALGEGIALYGLLIALIVFGSAGN